MNTITFKASRTEAREFAKAVQGKVKDKGADAPVGERWAVEYSVHPEGDKADAEQHIANANKSAPDLFMDSPINDLNIPEDVKIGAAAPKRQILVGPRKPKGIIKGQGYMRNTKNKNIPVYFKRSTKGAMATAELRRLMGH